MDLVVFIMLLLLLFLLPVFFILKDKKHDDRLPPGSLGLPVIGQSLGLLKALKADRVDEWFQERIAKHGPVWKSGLFGYPTVVLHGSSANKFIYTCDGNILTNTQPPSVSRILGTKNIIELSGHDHKRVRAALVSFLKLEVLKQYVAKVDEEIQHHLQTHWHGKHEVEVQPLIKTLTFNVICSLLFGIERGPKREKLLPLFQDMIEGVLAIPINLPFTQFNRGIVARKRLVPMLADLIREKREALEEQNQQGDAHKDLITSLISIRAEDSSTTMSDEEIIDNIIVVLVAGYDTTSVLVTFLVRLLANNKLIYSNILKEQKEIANSKSPGEALTWEDLTKMKYTWRVASEIMRIYPPVALSFRRAKQDIEYGGFIIPKGWQVLLSASMTHMDNDIFQNATMFDPTRFDKNAPSPPPFSYVAFGAGPRMCPGVELAKMETLAMIHRLVTQFTWELVKKDESFKRIPMPEFDHGLLVRITPI
ncbi:cytochrome P450 716B1-like protein [Tanacetum coccineum]